MKEPKEISEHLHKLSFSAQQKEIDSYVLSEAGCCSEKLKKLLQKMIQREESQRIAAKELMESDYFEICPICQKILRDQHSEV